MMKMKDSGYSYIDMIPISWEVTRNKNVFSCIKELVGSNSNSTQLLSLTTKGVKEKDINNPEGKLPESFDTYQYVKANDIVMCLFDLDVSAVFSGISPYDGMISPAYRVLTCKNNIVPQFADYWFKYISDGRKFNHYAKNIRYTLNYEDFSSLPIVFPPLEIQQRIADYLDDRCTKIDGIIEKQQAVIEKLKEYKLSVITEIVTKGLDKNVDMTVLDGEWADSIPTHWKWMSLKFVTEFITCGVAATPEYTDKDSGALFLSAQNVKQGIMDYSIERYITKELHESLTKKRKPKRGDLLQVRVGASIGNVAVVDTDEEFSVYVSLTHIRCNEMIKNEFLKFCMMSPLWLQKAFSYVDFAGSQGNLNVADLRILKIPVPPINEQIDIMNYLKTKTNMVDYNIHRKEEILNRLQEYKKSLIYEVVTGKKEV